MSAEKVEPISVEDSIRAAIVEVEEKADDDGQEDVQPPAGGDKEGDKEGDRARDETGKFTKKSKEAKQKETEGEEKPEDKVIKDDPAKTAEVQKPEAKVEIAPQSWGAAVKSKWNELPPEVRAEINKRETDIHQMMTRHDGELRLGRELKDVITPYMPQIQAEGGTPATAIQSLLNTAYQLRTANPGQKAALIGQICQQYGVDLTQINQPAQVDPVMQNVLNELNGLKQTITQQSTLQEQQESVRIQTEINAFAADPKNIYFSDPRVKAKMAPLLGSEQAKDLQEAYDAACWATPEIRTVLMAAQEKEQAEKRKDEIAKKKQAAASVTGSPGINTPSSTKTPKTVEDDLREVYDDVVGSKF